MTSADVNAYLKEITGQDITAKDFRTWAGTVLAAMALQEFETFDSQAKAKKNVRAAIERVASRLGNTPTICRKCYVHPEILSSYAEGALTLEVEGPVEAELRDDLASLKPEEAAVLGLLEARLERTPDRPAAGQRGRRRKGCLTPVGPARRTCGLRRHGSGRTARRRLWSGAGPDAGREKRSMAFDALFLSRIQFAFTISFHIIFPAFTIGLASWLARLEFEWLRTGNPEYKNLYKFWVKVFAVSFGLGVVSGIVMSYQLGTNWSRYSAFVGNVIGPLIAYEVITAFCLEAGFLGIMLFGWDRVGDRLHFVATCLVAIGTLISAFWILSANSWMQMPDGFRIENGIALPVDWWKIVFNPSFPVRYAHMVLGCFLTTAFAVAGMSAWMLLRHPHDAPEAKLAGARRSLSMALWFAAIVTPIQIFIGDMHGLGVLK